MNSVDQETLIDKANILASLAHLAETIKYAYETGNAELYASAYTEDDIMSMPAAPQIRGRAAIKAAFESRSELPKGATFEVQPTELDVISSEWAYAFGVDTLTYTPPGSVSPVVQTMTFMVLIRKTAEGWKTFREVLSADQ